MSDANVFEDLPGDLMIWVLIVSELLVFGAGLAAFLAVRITDPAGFAAAQDVLHRTGAGINTVVLVTSGFLAAMAVRYREGEQRLHARLALMAAAGLGVLFLIIKGAEFAHKSDLGITWETHPFYTFYYLLTGFHAAHVVAGVVILLLIAWRDAPRNIEAGAAFWHMVDLVWVLLFPGDLSVAMMMRRLFLAWCGLIGLSAASTLLSLPVFGPGLQWALGLGVLTLAWLKARLILVHYLGLIATPFWRHGFEISLACFCLLLLGLYLGPVMF